MAKMMAKKTTVKTGGGGSTTVKSTTTKRNIPVNDATRKKYTDTAKKAEAVKAGPGKPVAPKGTTMGTAQRTYGKQQAEAFKSRNGSYPTPEFRKKNPNAK